MFGTKLKTIRKHFSVTQDEMAGLLNISARTYASYERGENNPPYSMLVLLCSKHKINLNWFIADEGEMFIAPEFNDIKEELLKEVNGLLAKYGIKNQ